MTPDARYSAVLFDYDGTLVDSLPGIHATAVAVLAEEGREAPGMEAVRAAMGQGLVEFFQRLGVSPQERAYDLAMAYRERYAETGAAVERLYPGVQALLEGLRARGLYAAIVSNKRRVAVTNSLRRHGLQGLVNHVAGAEMGFDLKPSPAFFTEYLKKERPDLDPAATLMVGDAAPDMGFSREAGLAACYAAYGYGDEAACLAYGPEHVIRALADLEDIL